MPIVPYYAWNKSYRDCSIRRTDASEDLFEYFKSSDSSIKVYQSFTSFTFTRSWRAVNIIFHCVIILLLLPLQGTIYAIFTIFHHAPCKIILCSLSIFLAIDMQKLYILCRHYAQCFSYLLCPKLCWRNWHRPTKWK